MFRIVIQQYNKGKYNHVKQFVCNDIKGIDELIENYEFHQQWVQSKSEQILKKQFEKKRLDFMSSDLFDNKSVNKKANKLDFLKNEIWYEANL